MWLIISFWLLKKEIREIMAELGVRKFQDLIGKSEYLEKNKAIKHWKAKNIDLSNILHKPNHNKSTDIFNSSKQNHDLEFILDRK